MVTDPFVFKIVFLAFTVVVVLGELRNLKHTYNFRNTTGKVVAVGTAMCRIFILQWVMLITYEILTRLDLFLHRL